MNPPRPNKNRRVSKPHHRKHQHLLEVSVRRDIARVQRIRAVLGFICKSVLIVGLIVGAYLGAKECLRRFLWENPDYYLSEIRVVTDGTLTLEQVRNATGIVEGRNIFTVDLAKGREALDRLPQIERVELQRILPNKIEIVITERRPIAWAVQHVGEDPTVSERAFLVDARGVAMRIKAKLPEYLSLPVIAGVPMENVVLGQKVRSYEMQAALDLIRLNSDSTRFQPRSLDISKGYCVVVTDQNRRKITFALDRVDRQVERLMHYLDFVEPSGKKIQTVNLLIERNTPIVFEEPVIETPEANTLPALKIKSSLSQKKGEPLSTPAVAPASTPLKSSTPSGRSPAPSQKIKKPFRLNG
jgi:cell division septal protein FtsQ